MPTLKDLFKGFLRERKEYKNITPKTEISYRKAFLSFVKVLPEIENSEDLNRDVLLSYFERLNEAGVSPVSRNTYGRHLNAFFVWIHNEGFTDQKLKLPTVATGRSLVKVLPEEYVEVLLKFEPRDHIQKRTHTLLLLLLETGLRISEALSLLASDVDMMRCTLRVTGKGRKERLVKFHPELRRRLNKFMGTIEYKRIIEDLDDYYIFCNRNGGPLLYDNIRRDYRGLCKEMGIDKVGGFHRFRHHFGSNYIKKGGNVFELSDQMGHSDLKTTRIYVTVDEAQLERTNSHTSILGNWKKDRRSRY